MIAPFFVVVVDLQRVIQGDGESCYISAVQYGLGRLDDKQLRHIVGVYVAGAYVVGGARDAPGAI